MLALYGHPFSSYTWKALIALYAYEIPFEFRVVDADHTEHASFIESAGPQGKFPVLKDGDNVLFESSAILEYLAQRHGANGLLPEDPSAALGVRMLDRVFDNYVMNIMQIAVNEAIRTGGNPDQACLVEVGAKLTRTYAWLEGWLEYYPPIDRVTLIECAAAPSLFYADWVHPIGDEFPRLKRWRAHLLSLEPVARCVDDARPYRDFFPLGAPDRD